MANPVEQIMCPVCGVQNPSDSSRCNSCGARLEGVRESARESELPNEWQQDTFGWKWVWISFGLYVTLQAIVLVILPLLIEQYDPQGLPGMAISAAVWFVGGLTVGVVSPGKTFMEPAVGALLSVVPTTLYLQQIADVHELSMLGYLVGGMLGVMVTMLGSLLGELIQKKREAH